MAYKDWRSMGPKNFTEYCKKNGKTSIVLSSNRPYDVQLYPDADAILAVYGAKGSTASLVAALTKKILTDKNAYGPNLIAGVEVLFGVFDATGTLPVNIPVFDPKTGEFTKDVKYPRGYGLTYKEVKPEPTPSKKIIVTAKAKIKSLKVGKRKITVKAKVKPSALKCTRYQLAYKVKGAKKWKYKSSKSKTIKLKHLKKGKRYKVKLRAVKVVDGKAYYGPWSKKQTTKKVK
jgi:beta-N-acetylhexosaminidase